MTPFVYTKKADALADLNTFSSMNMHEGRPLALVSEENSFTTNGFMIKRLSDLQPHQMEKVSHIAVNGKIFEAL